MSFLVTHSNLQSFFNLDSFLFTLLVCLRWWGKPDDDEDGVGDDDDEGVGGSSDDDVDGGIGKGR